MFWGVRYGRGSLSEGSDIFAQPCWLNLRRWSCAPTGTLRRYSDSKKKGPFFKSVNEMVRWLPLLLQMQPWRLRKKTKHSGARTECARGM